MLRESLFLLCFLPLFCFGQQKKYYDKGQREVSASDTFYFYETVEKQLGGVRYVRRFTPKDSLIYEGAYSSYKKEKTDVPEGVHRAYGNNGVLLRMETFKNGKSDGEMRGYYPSGKLRRLETYKKGKFVKGEMYNEDGSPREFTPRQQQPVYPGGPEAMQRHFLENLNYPDEAYAKGIEGKVSLTFVVNKDGSVSDVTIINDPGGGLGQEAARLVQTMGNWIPGSADDHPVKVRYTIPLRFRLEDAKQNKKN